MNRLKIVIFLVLFSHGGDMTGQVLKSIIADDDTHEPIPGVYVFVPNSSIGTTTDFDGRWQLDMNDHHVEQLIISHLNYKNLELDLDDPLLSSDTIFLVETPSELDNVVLNAKFKSRLRKKRLRRFSNALLGEGKERKKTVIQNPESILFVEEGGELQATATEPIVIRNEHLGYDINFFLEEFRIDHNEDGIYQGKIHFEALEPESPRQKASYLKNRKQVLRFSKRRFFKDLVENSMDEETYLLFMCYMTSNRKFEKLRDLHADSIDVKQLENGLYKIEIKNYLAVKDLRLNSRKVEKSVGMSRNFNPSIKPKKKEKDVSGVSYLTSKSGYILVSNNGVVQNPSDLIEFGFWSERRLATMLPYDYSFQ